MTDHINTDDFLAIGQLAQLPLDEPRCPTCGAFAEDYNGDRVDAHGGYAEHGTTYMCQICHITWDTRTPPTPPAWLRHPLVLAELTRDITALRQLLARANRAYCAEAPLIPPAMQRLLAYALGELELQARVMKANVEERLEQ